MTMPEFPQPRKGVYATFDEEGRPTGFYFEASHGPKLIPVERLVETDSLREFPSIAYDMVPNPDCKIPPEAVQITREEWRRLVDSGGE